MSRDFSITHSFSERKRTQIREAAAVMGIDEAYLSDLVDEFYARIRANARLGPIFEARLGTDWRPHLERMKHFWASIALSAGSYSGNPIAMHQQLQGVERQDFELWLALFRTTLNDTAPTAEAVQYLTIRAERIAQSLLMAMFAKGRTGVPVLR